ncbi:hypothetical protein QTL95_08675 [Rhizobium sp. S152]|uniref:hypothetical protein n=1 Tax=Rhizobium sp. S152 TaxID=3055038 RepID=UPI0025A95EDE|nr:hypothetical protein [Rhizobium sp. S152]MDM9625967.1 hypothetical protein [Rhizobium sp. S152]
MLHTLFGPARKRERSIRKAIQSWEKRDYSEYSPQFIKERMFRKHGVDRAQWVETGTYLGTTTQYLADFSPFVHSIEPEPELHRKASEKFAGQNVKIHKGTSEEIMPDLLASLSGDVNFWLDGHYSAGITFRGENDCPIVQELAAISNNLNHLGSVSILIDDVRCFLPENFEQYRYPDISELIAWANRHEFSWRIEHDIFVMKKSVA